MRVVIAAAVSVVLALAAANAAAQSSDGGPGEGLFNQQCKICHTLNKDGANLVGPNLFGMFGRKAGTAKGFASSDAMTKSGIVWDDKALGDYLTDPKGRVPGTKMVYAGLKRQEQLDDLIAYLRKATQ